MYARKNAKKTTTTIGKAMTSGETLDEEDEEERSESCCALAGRGRRMRVTTPIILLRKDE